MKRYLFIGPTTGNTGPSNVNKGLVSSFNDDFFVLDFSKLYQRIFKHIIILFAMLSCKVIIFSGFSKYGVKFIKLSKILHIRTIYLMHGCYEIESSLNETSVDNSILKTEKYFLENIDFILTVSKSFSKLIMDKYNIDSNRISYLYNGVSKPASDFSIQDMLRSGVIAVGGDRKLKNNLVVANAIARLKNSEKLKVYGYIYKPNNLPFHKNIEFKGLIPQEELYEVMSHSSLFILNSIYEPFGLSLFDALLSGCSILVSKNVGAAELLNLTDNDIIFDPMDEVEISQKINYLINNPNNERILTDFDFKKNSYSARVSELVNICEKLINSQGSI